MTAAETEARADLEVLRERADQTGREAARTLAELAARLAAAKDPRAVTRRVTARTTRRVQAAVQAMRGNRAARRAAVAAVPALGVLTVAVVAHRQGWLKSDSLLQNGRVPRLRRLPFPEISAASQATHATRIGPIRIRRRLSAAGGAVED